MEFKGKMIKVEVTHIEPDPDYREVRYDQGAIQKNLLSGYKQEDLAAAFKAVQNSEHWKNPINAPVPQGIDIELLAYAIMFYTGSVARFSGPNNKRRVKADGYYKAIGA